MLFLYVLTIPRLQEPRQPCSQNFLRFMLKDKWLIIKVVFLHTNLSWKKTFSFYYSEVAKQEKVDTKNPFPPSVYIVQIFLCYV